MKLAKKVNALEWKYSLGVTASALGCIQRESRVSDENVQPMK